MVLRVRLVGDGSGDDPYRVSLPTYRLVDFNPHDNTALVDIPDDVHGLAETDRVKQPVSSDMSDPQPETLSDAAIAKMHKHFDIHYREHKGKFKVEQV